jgi:hypothetical protein
MASPSQSSHCRERESRNDRPTDRSEAGHRVAVVQQQPMLPAAVGEAFVLSRQTYRGKEDHTEADHTAQKFVLDNVLSIHISRS